MDTSRPFFPSPQHDEVSVDFPEITVWDFGFGHTEGFSSQRAAQGIGLVDNRRGKMPGELQQTECGNENRDVLKRMSHRDIERKRRQDMANLYASLRSVLPADILKGKRSISDQIQGATKYIKLLQSNIKELESQRDRSKLKKSLRGELFQDSEKESCSKTMPIVVKVEPCLAGVEVLISGDFIAQGLITVPQSRILQLLLQEGLSAVSCNCTKHDGRLHLMIQCEVLGCHGVNLQMLQRKLVCIIGTWIDTKQ